MIIRTFYTVKQKNLQSVQTLPRLIVPYSWVTFEVNYKVLTTMKSFKQVDKKKLSM